MNYLRIAWRNLKKNKGFTFIYILGLSIGLAVFILDCLWIHDELSFNKYHKHYDRIAQVMHNAVSNSEITTLFWNPYHLGDLLNKQNGSDFNQVVMSTYPGGHILAYGDKKLTVEGNFMSPGTPAMLSLEFVSGSQNGLGSLYSILLSETTARNLFGSENPIGRTIRLENKTDVNVTGVYKDIPSNSDFSHLYFIAPWELYLTIFPNMKIPNPWDNNNFLTYVQLTDQADINKVSAKIKDLKKNDLKNGKTDPYKKEFFLFPMSKWHLYSEFKNGINTGGSIEYVWLFGLIGIFVLLLACINFMNLSTATAQSRAKEIGIRKTIGSLRRQLFLQFMAESMLLVFFAFLVSLILVMVSMPFFNGLSGKDLHIFWNAPIFWIASLLFCFLTGILAGLYPALYLSSFKPVNVLKGTFRFSPMAILQRKSLVVLQFIVSTILIISTLVVIKQLQFARDAKRIGYNPNNLITLFETPEIHNHFAAFRDEIEKSGMVEQVVESTSPTTEYYVDDGHFNWPGKDPNLQVDFPISSVSPNYGKTIGWEILQGRDFSNNMASDSNAFIINEAAARFMSLKNPVGTRIERFGKFYTVIGVIKDIIFESPYQPVHPYIYMTNGGSYVLTIKLNKEKDVAKALSGIKSVFGKYNPELPFDYKFVDQEYGKKFQNEERTGKLSGFFALLAVFISCLGIFGLAIVVADQRIKEIGIRKVLGSTVFKLWILLARDFIMLAILSLLIASPVSFYLMNRWLQNYPSHTEISAMVFVIPIIGLLF
ncbi:MAG TPA: ABC transporter permease, partial [Puia sp.]|nr:ABC transporter permease [Puia sp.]